MRPSFTPSALIKLKRSGFYFEILKLVWASCRRSSYFDFIYFWGVGIVCQERVNLIFHVSNNKNFADLLQALSCMPS